jgi:hypothetical protein
MSLPVLASDPDQIEQAADPVGYVILACERAKAWLADALEHGQIEDIVELKSQAEAIRVYTAQKQIGKDAELSAAEIVRRAERGIGIAIRRGQEAGEITHAGQSRGPQRDYVRNGKLVHAAPPVPDEKRISPQAFFNGGQEAVDTYAVTDGVTDEQFDSALNDAKNEGNLSRANVVRKVQARKDRDAADGPDLSTPEGRRARIAELAAANYSSRQIAEMIGISDEYVRINARKMGIEIPADKTMARTRRHDSNRIVEQTVHALDGLRMGIELIDFSTLDREKLPAWSTSLTASLRSLNQLARRLKEADPP